MKHVFLINPKAGQGDALDLENVIRTDSELRYMFSMNKDLLKTIIS